MTTPAKKYYGCGDCDPCIGGRPDQCAVGGMVLAVENELMTTPAEKCAERIVEELWTEPLPFAKAKCEIVAIIQSEYAEIFKTVREAMEDADRAFTKIRNAPGTTLNPHEMSQMAYEAHNLIRTALAQLEGVGK